LALGYCWRIVMYSYSGKILHVDLSNQRTRVQEVGEDFYKMYLGGVGVATRLLYENLPRGADPLGPDNVLVFAGGAFGGTIVPAGSKYALATKSPLTGFIGDSLSGSFWAQALRHAGWDAIVIKGKARSPSYLFIDGEDVQFRSAEQLVGRECFETEEAIREELEDDQIRVASIGIAGEKMVRYACVSNDRGRQAGRTGNGAVMGSKNLKAVAIRGARAVRVAQLDELMKVSLELIGRAQGPGTEKYRIGGTPGNVLVFDRMGILPTRNFRETTFERAEEISGEYLRRHHLEKTVACAACPIACEQVVGVVDGTYEGSMVSVDYESLFALGPCCGIGSFPAIIKACEMCDRYGLDTISTGVTISWAMECYERGLLSKEDTQGLDLKFGNEEAALSLIKMIASRQGIGDLLAEGSRRAARRVGKGSEDFAIQVKGLELPGYDPRGLKTLALGFAVGTRGACHNRSAAYEPDMKGKVDRFKAEKGRGRLAAEQEDFAAILDSLIICKFIRGCFTDFYSESARMFTLTTGIQVNPEDLRAAGARISSLKKAFNIREGWTRADDWLPARFLNEPVPAGASAGAYIGEDGLRLMIDDYYEFREWTAEGLIPRAKLAQLGLGDVAQEIGV
ncbi:MAG: aldehyde ferredoxin oxidoreductase family protein, partial [Chloroflexi bacterium]|nr:aldehyde ferredoxin oxidoreductase family protein [Chloroflexota bacterium]